LLYKLTATSRVRSWARGEPIPRALPHTILTDPLPTFVLEAIIPCSKQNWVGVRLFGDLFTSCHCPPSRIPRLKSLIGWGAGSLQDKGLHSGLTTRKCGFGTRVIHSMNPASDSWNGILDSWSLGLSVPQLSNLWEGKGDPIPYGWALG
jgi:hypothetical protein